MVIDLWDLKVGARLELESGAVAQVAAPTEDGEWIKVQYVKVPENPALEGTEDLCSVDEVAGLA